MRLTRVFVSGPIGPAGSLLTLPRDAADHVSKVLRMKVGAQLVVFDGAGGEYSAELAEIERKTVSVRVGDGRDGDRESPLRIVLLQSLARGEKMDWVVQKATELGVACIIPVATERSVVQLDAERAAKRVEHWRAVAIGACEQSGRNRVPDITAPMSLQAACESQASLDLRVQFHPEANTNLGGMPSAPRSVALLIGPEGGLDAVEAAEAERLGFAPLRFGPRVLRTETAAIAGITALQLRWGDLGS